MEIIYLLDSSINFLVDSKFCVKDSSVLSINFLSNSIMSLLYSPIVDSTSINFFTISFLYPTILSRNFSIFLNSPFTSESIIFIQAEYAVSIAVK